MRRLSIRRHGAYVCKRPGKRPGECSGCFPGLSHLRVLNPEICLLMERDPLLSPPDSDSDCQRKVPKDPQRSGFAHKWFLQVGGIQDWPWTTSGTRDQILLGADEYDSCFQHSLLLPVGSES